MPTRTGLKTHHDLPGICTFGPVPIPGLHFYNAKTLTSAQLRSQIALQGTGATYCVHFHSLRHILTGQQLLDWNQHEPDDQLIYVELLHTVEGNTPQRTQDLWILRVDPKTGSVSPHDNDEDVWDLDSLINPDPEDTAFHDPIPNHEAMAIARRALDIRSADRDFSDAHALEQAMPAVAAAVTNFLVHRSPDQSDDNGEADTNDVAVHRAMETLDRAYGRARIANAGINLRIHPQLHTYQFFYQLGFAPPTHQDMADHIVNHYSPAPVRCMRRIIRRILGLPGSNNANLHLGHLSTQTA